MIEKTIDKTKDNKKDNKKYVAEVCFGNIKKYHQKVTKNNTFWGENHYYFL